MSTLRDMPVIGAGPAGLYFAILAKLDDPSRRIVVYSWVMAVWSLLLVPATSWIYAVVAVAGGAYFLLRAHRLHAGIVAGHEVVPMKLFHLSNMYLCGLFAAIAVDAAVGLPVLGGVPF